MADGSQKFDNPLIFAVFSKNGAEFTVNLHDHYPKPEQRAPLQLSEKQIGLGDLVGAKFFVIGVSGGPVKPGAAGPSVLFFSAHRDPKQREVHALERWFEVMLGGAKAFSRTRADQPGHAAERAAWASNLQQFPFMGAVPLERERSVATPVLWAERAGADLSIGGDLDFTVTTRLSHLGQLELSATATCPANCYNWPFCPNPNASAHTPHPS